MCVFKLEKVYNPKNEEDDMVEMEEERLRMREHVMNEVSHHNNTSGSPMSVIDTLMISPDQAPQMIQASFDCRQQNDSDYDSIVSLTI